MRKMIVIALTIGVVAAACGGTDDTADPAETTAAVLSSSTSGADADQPSATTPAFESNEPGETAPSPAPSETGGPVATDEASNQPEDTQPPTATTSPPSGQPPQPEDPPGHSNPLIAKAVADLADRLGVAQTDIIVVSFESVTWPNGAMGCPQPGMQYTQVMTDGAKSVLEYGGITYSYHSGGVRDPFLCETPEK